MVHSLSRPAPHKWRLLICVVAMAMVSLTATADSTSRTTRPDPLDPKATVPAVTYASSLTLGQRPTTDGPVSWREANDAVTRIGGWRVYAREASQPAPEPTATPTLAPASAAVLPVPTWNPHAHGGHHKP